MLSRAFRLLSTIALVTALTVTRLAESTSEASSQCDCLPDRFQGRIRASDLGSSNVQDVARLALINKLYNDPAAFADDLEILFKVDLLSGLMIFESAPSNRHHEQHQSPSNGDLRQWAVVIDVGHLLASSSLSPAEQFALVYFVDKESNKVWNVNIGSTGRRHLLNRCPMRQSGWQKRKIDGVDLLYLAEGQFSLPILMAMSRGSCLPSLLSDATRVALIFDFADELHVLESSILMYEAKVLREYLQQGTNVNLDNNSNMNDRTTALVMLIMHWLLTSDNRNPIVTPKACCTPMKWQASAVKFVDYNYKVMDQQSGAQTMMMDRLYVDREEQAVAGSFYQIVDGKQSANFTFLALLNTEVSQSIAVYVVDKSANVCMAENITGVKMSMGRNCMSQDAANFIGQINFGMQMSLEGWEKSFNDQANGYSGTFKQYVAMVNSQSSASQISDQVKDMPTCMTVVGMSDWETPLENVSAMTMFYNAELKVPDDAFAMPPSCVGVDMITMPVDTTNEVFEPIVGIASTL